MHTCQICLLIKHSRAKTYRQSAPHSWLPSYITNNCFITPILSTTPPSCVQRIGPGCGDFLSHMLRLYLTLQRSHVGSWYRVVRRPARWFIVLLYVCSAVFTDHLLSRSIRRGVSGANRNDGLASRSCPLAWQWIPFQYRGQRDWMNDDYSASHGVETTATFIIQIPTLNNNFLTSSTFTDTQTQVTSTNLTPLHLPLSVPVWSPDGRIIKSVS